MFLRSPQLMSLAILSCLCLLCGCTSALNPSTSNDITLLSLLDESATAQAPSQWIVRYDRSGRPALEGAPFTQMDAPALSSLADGLTLSAATMAAAQARDIQQIDVELGAGGLELWVNGWNLPSIGWDAARLGAAQALLTTYSPQLASLPQQLQRLEPQLLKIAIRFPANANGANLALSSDGKAVTTYRAQQAAFLATVGAAPRIQIPLFYEVDGGWRVGGLNQTEWQALTGLPWEALMLPPSVLANAAAAEISQVEISTDREGLYVTIADRELPTLRWGDGRLRNAIALATGAYPLVADATSATAPAIEQALPILLAAEVQINIFFPDRQGKYAIQE